MVLDGPRNLTRKPAVGKHGGNAIRVVFLCHMPALWSKTEPIYRAMIESDDFEPIVVTVPQESEPDDAIAKWLGNRGVRSIPGRSASGWIELGALRPDYIFHAVPYSCYFPEALTPKYLAGLARLCYLPYVSQLIFSGGVADTLHDLSYFKNAPLAFLSDEEERRHLVGRIGGGVDANGFTVVGSPQLEEIMCRNKLDGRNADRMRILWTPRWHTKEGNCHFFEHKDLLLDLAEGDSRIHLTFRPHPLCLENFLRTGELSRQEHDRLLQRIRLLPNADMDTDGDYLTTMEQADVLVSDMSSMLSDFFVTGKPVIYTHRVDHFNELGRFMSKGFYWVTSPDELRERLSDLAQGKDPLREMRLALRKELLARMPTGSVTRILEAIREDRGKN